MRGGETTACDAQKVTERPRLQALRSRLTCRAGGCFEAVARNAEHLYVASAVCDNASRHPNILEDAVSSFVDFAESLDMSRSPVSKYVAPSAHARKHRWFPSETEHGSIACDQIVEFCACNDEIGDAWYAAPFRFRIRIGGLDASNSDLQPFSGSNFPAVR